ncbi:MAG: hypothetical protein Q4D38_08365 [Planctomycetia bacterium]|nr:hypothetical protein [Planctomycetia bacterium]
MRWRSCCGCSVFGLLFWLVEFLRGSAIENRSGNDRADGTTNAEWEIHRLCGIFSEPVSRADANGEECCAGVGAAVERLEPEFTLPHVREAFGNEELAPGSTMWTWVADEKTGILISETETPHKLDGPRRAVRGAEIGWSVEHFDDRWRRVVPKSLRVMLFYTGAQMSFWGREVSGAVVRSSDGGRNRKFQREVL